MFKNYLVFASLAAYAVAQVSKTILYSIMHRRLELKRLVGSGGMPSSHSATVAALATAAFRKFGPESAHTAIAIILAVIVIYDARGVRQEAGKHAQLLNNLIKRMQGESDEDIHKQLDEMVGHTLFQVIIGLFVGVSTALLIPVI